MGLFSRLRDTFIKAPGPEAALGSDQGLEDVRKEMRMHSRFAVSFYRNAIVNVNSTWVGRIIDLSYGGAAVKFEFPEGIPSDAPNLDQEVEINILGRVQKFHTKAVRTVHQGSTTCYIGLCFDHRSPETLIFLREVIEPMRQGLSLGEIPTNLRSDKYKDQSWHCFRGEGPIDVILKMDADRMTDGLITFKMTDQYFEVAFKDGSIRTAKSEAKASRGVSAKMIPSATPDRETLCRAFLMLASAPAPVTSTTAPFLQLIEGELGFDQKRQGAA